MLTTSCHYCRVGELKQQRGIVNHRVITITDPACISEINEAIGTAVAKPMHNVVQNSQWPDIHPVSSAAGSGAVTDIDDEPGSWSSVPSGAQPAQTLHASMAHTMRLGRVLRPVPVPEDLQLKKVSTPAQRGAFGVLFLLASVMCAWFQRLS